MMSTMTATDYAQARETMVEQQVRPWDVLDPRVLEVLTALPRDVFVPAEHRALAYVDLPLPLGHGEVMMKPVVEGRMLQALAIGPGDSVLEIGTGSGFTSACLGRLARDVTSLELRADFADAARARLAGLGLDQNLRIETVDALTWHGGEQPCFDAIALTGAVARLQDVLHFAQWLRPGGRLFAVHGHAPAMEAVLLRNDGATVDVQSLFETDLPYLAGAAPVPRFQF